MSLKWPPNSSSSSCRLSSCSPSSHDFDCAKILAASISTPQSCAYKWLRQAAATLKAKQQLLFTNQQTAVINQFNIDYNSAITVSLYSALGRGITSLGTFIYTEGAARAAVNIPGFNRFSSGDYLSFTFMARDDGGEVMYVELKTNIANEPIVC